MKACATQWLVAVLLSVPGMLDAQSFNYNASDQRTDPTFQYDANGNLINDGSTQYRYDTANRLTRTINGVDVVEYRYDGAGNLVAVGRRTTAQTQSNWTELTPNVASSLPETLMEVTGSGTTQETVRYAYGPAGLAAMTRQVGSGAVEARMAVTDFQGTVRHLYNGVAPSHSRYYDAWGRLRSSSGNADGLTLGYTGERENADGTVYLRARHYSPALNRFLQRDSIDAGFAGQGTQGHNRYAYVSGNPSNGTDPSGHASTGPNNPIANAWNDFQRGFMTGAKQATTDPFAVSESIEKRCLGIWGVIGVSLGHGLASGRFLEAAAGSQFGGSPYVRVSPRWQARPRVDLRNDGQPSIDMVPQPDGGLAMARPPVRALPPGAKPLVIPQDRPSEAATALGKPKSNPSVLLKLCEIGLQIYCLGSGIGTNLEKYGIPTINTGSIGSPVATRAEAMSGLFPDGKPSSPASPVDWAKIARDIAKAKKIEPSKTPGSGKAKGPGGEPLDD